MKKILAVLLAVAMVATALFAVFTPAGADTVNAVKLTATSECETRFQFKTGIAAAENAQIEAVVSIEGVTGELSSWLLRGADADTASGGPDKKYTTTAEKSTDGKWVKLTATVPNDSNWSTGKLALTVNLSKPGAKVDDYIEVLYIKVNDTTYTPAEIFDSVAAYSNSPSFTAEVVEVGENEGADKINCYSMPVRKEGYRARVSVAADVKVGDKITLFIKPVAGKGTPLEELDLYLRTNGKPATYADGTEAYSGAAICRYAVACVDGWYYVECTATAADDSIEICVDTSDETKPVALSYFAGLAVKGVEVTGEVTKYSSSDVGDITATEIPVPEVVEPTSPSPKPSEEPTSPSPKPSEEPTSPSPKPSEEPTSPSPTPSVEPTSPSPKPSEEPTSPSPTPSVEPTDDETEDIEPTGAISAAVVAIAAVIGGAVVLKKREF